jgi:predicted AAA+ superfamily ATPase
MLINRDNIISKIWSEYDSHQVCALVGPRQCGKTTIAKNFASNIKEPILFFDLENPIHLAMLESPMLALEDHMKFVIIDEVQLRPDLFPILRVLVDSHPSRKFLITGSASRDLLKQSSETLAGRIGYLQITPFNIEEACDSKKLWKVGGFPKSFLSKSDSASERWRDEYIKTFLERDILKLGFDITPRLITKLWKMIAHYHGQILNIYSLGQSLDMDQRTVKKYLEILEGAFMINMLKPFHTNLAKRQVKSPKIYIRDSGLLHRLLGLRNDDIEFNPSLGASFEGFAIEEIIRYYDSYDNSYFWATHNGAELDLLIEKGRKRIGFEIKYTDHPKITKSIHIALESLNLDHLYLIIPGNEEFKMSDKVTCCGIEIFVSKHK